MKAAKLIFSLLFISGLVKAQEVDDFLIYNEKEIAKFIKTTTYVVLDQHKESGFSLALKDAVEKYWTITKFEIIDQGTFREYSKDKTKSFLTRNYIAGSKDLITLNLFMGGQRGMETKGKILASVKMKHSTETDEAMLYKVPIYEQNIQWQTRMIKDYKYTAAADFKKFYKSQGFTKKNRTLYILTDHLTYKIDDMEKVKKYYKNDVAIVEAEQIAKAINTSDSSIIFLSIVAPIKNWKGQNGYYRIYSANGGETIESYTRGVSSSAPLGVTGYDLKTFNK